MQVLLNIKSEHIVAIDIETVRIEKDFNNLDEGTQSAWEYKNKQDGEIPDNLAELWEKNASLYAEFSKVCAVSMAFLDKSGVLNCYQSYGSNEHNILKEVGAFLNKVASNRDFRLIGHAAKFFDYPFLTKRYIINGLDIPNILDTTALKPWEGKSLCSNELWKVGGTGAGSSLQALCNCLNVPVSKVDLVGDEVGKAFYNNEFERIGTYCSYDAVATFNVFRRFKKEEIFNFDEVKYVDIITTSQKQPKEIKECNNVVERLVNKQPVTKKEVKDTLKKLNDYPNKEIAKPLIDLIGRFS